MGSWGSSDKCSSDSRDIVGSDSRVLNTYPCTSCIRRIQPHKQARGVKRMHKTGWIENWPFCTVVA